MSFVEKIQYKDEFLNEANINQNISVLWGKALPIFMHRKYLQDRFTRKYDQKDVVVALEYYISILDIQNDLLYLLVFLLLRINLDKFYYIPLQ